MYLTHQNLSALSAESFLPGESALCSQTGLTANPLMAACGVRGCEEAVEQYVWHGNCCSLHARARGGG